jgi:hypothetical protein
MIRVLADIKIIKNILKLFRLKVERVLFSELAIKKYTVV